MSSTAPLPQVAVIASLSVQSAPLPAQNAPQASNSVVVTDASGVTYAAVVLTGAETPPWSWAATYAVGSAQAIVTALDTAGAAIGTPATFSFVVPAQVTPATYQAATGISVQLANTSAATAAVHSALKAP